MDKIHGRWTLREWTKLGNTSAKRTLVGAQCWENLEKNPAGPVYGSKSGTELDPEICGCRVENQLGLARGAEGYHPAAARFPVGRGEAHQEQVVVRLHCQRGRGEVEAVGHGGGVRQQRQLLCGTRPLKALRFVVSVAASRGKTLAFSDVVAAFVHVLIDDLVILLLPGGLW